MSGGLTTMLPIMRVLLDGQTVSDWANSQIVEKRLGRHVWPKTGKSCGSLRSSMITRRLPPASRPANSSCRPGTPNGPAGVAVTLALLSDPSRGTARVSREAGPDLDLALPPVPFYLAAEKAVASRVSTHPVWAVAEVFGFLAVLSILGNILKFFQEYLSDKAATLAVNDIRRRLYDHVLHVPLGHFGSNGTSDVTSRLVQDSTALEQGFKTVLGQSIQQPITASMAFARRGGHQLAA